MRRLTSSLLAALACCLGAARDARADDWQPGLPNREHFEEGRFVYERNCIVCHGPFGDGKGEMAAGLAIKPRSFRTGVFKYRTTPAGKLPTNEDLKRTIREGITGTAMGMFTTLREEELTAVVEYLKGFSRKWRDPENYAQPVKLPASPEWLWDNAVRARHEAAGEALFRTVCAACHGPGGAGDGPAVATLKDDLGNPAQPADLRAPHYRNGNHARDIFRVLSLGIAGTPMVSFEASLSEEQRWQLAAYLRRLSGAAE